MPNDYCKQCGQLWIDTEAKRPQPSSIVFINFKQEGCKHCGATALSRVKAKKKKIKNKTRYEVIRG